MLIVIFGPSCSGKSTAATELARRLSCEVYAGKDYLRLAGSEPAAWKTFDGMLRKAAGDQERHLVYVVTGRSPAMEVPGAFRVRFTAGIELLVERFARRNQPGAVPGLRSMLERQASLCAALPAEMVFDTSGPADPRENAGAILSAAGIRPNTAPEAGL